MIERWSQLWDTLGLKVYSYALYYHIPEGFFECMLSIFLVGAVVLCVWKGLKKGIQFSAALLCIEYVVLVFCSTIVFRDPLLERDFNLRPFWSYSNPNLYAENLMNFLVFVPIGLLLGVSIKGLKMRNALLAGICLSVFIEIFQFVLKKGFAEVDDVVHNTLGCMIGYGAYYMIVWFFRRIRSYVKLSCE